MLSNNNGEINMIIIFDQNKTYIKNNLREASELIKTIYGEKLGLEAIKALNNECIGSSWRKNGGPLIQIVNKEKANWIREKETAIDMM